MFCTPALDHKSLAHACFLPLSKQRLILFYNYRSYQLLRFTSVTITLYMYFILGDLDIGGMYNCVRAYCPATNSWRGVVQNHPPSQRGMQAALLKISNAKISALLWEQRKLTRAEHGSSTAMVGCSNFSGNNPHHMT